MDNGSTSTRGRGARLADVLDTHRGGANHSDALDGLRGFAIAAVFLVHFHPWVSPFLPRGWVFDLSARLGDMGNIGVDVFFVLSGVLIHGAILRRPQPFPDFFRRRLQRLYPTFLVVFVPVLLIELARGAPTLSGGPGPVVNLIGNLTLLAGFLPIDPLIVVAWTLSWEIVFYVTLPFLFWAGRLRTRSPGVRLAIIGVVWVGMSVSGALQSAGNARILLFLCGVAVAEWSAAGRPGRALLPVGAPIAALAAIGADVWCTFAGHIDAEGIHYPAGTWALWGRLGVYFVALPIVVAGAMEARGVVPTALARPLIRRMGDFSYSYYLSHALVIRAIGEIAGRAVDPATHKSGWWWFVALPPTFAATVVVAVILFLCVERPCSISPDPAVTVLPPRIVRWPWQAPPRSEAGRRTL